MAGAGHWGKAADRGGVGPARGERLVSGHHRAAQRALKRGCFRDRLPERRDGAHGLRPWTAGDREVIGFVASTEGLTGSMVRDPMRG